MPMTHAPETKAKDKDKAKDIHDHFVTWPRGSSRPRHVLEDYISPTMHFFFNPHRLLTNIRLEDMTSLQAGNQ